MLKFLPYYGDTGELLTSDKYIVFRWVNNNCKVLFSVTQKGNAANCHFTSDKKGLRYLEEALNDWCEFCFWMLDWCELVLGVIERPSVARLAEKCGFEKIASQDNKQIYIRRKTWVA